MIAIRNVQSVKYTPFLFRHPVTNPYVCDILRIVFYKCRNDVTTDDVIQHKLTFFGGGIDVIAKNVLELMAIDRKYYMYVF